MMMIRNTNLWLLNKNPKELTPKKECTSNNKLKIKHKQLDLSSLSNSPKSTKMTSSKLEIQDTHPLLLLKNLDKDTSTIEEAALAERKHYLI